MADLSDIIRQLAYYRAGGGRKTTAEDIGNLLGGIGGALGTAGKGIETGIELRKKMHPEQFISPKEQAEIEELKAKGGLYKAQEEFYRQKPDIERIKQIGSIDQPVITKEQEYEIAKTGGTLKKGTKIIDDPSQLSGFGKAYIQARREINLPKMILDEAPSRLSPTTASGAASQVQLAVRQGKGLIAKPGSPQQLALAASDLARAVQRSAPQLDTLRESGFSNNIVTRLSFIAQKITADPTSKDVPKLRKQLYDIFNELERTSRPVVERQLRNIEIMYGKNLPTQWPEFKAGELGYNFPDIPFQEDSGIPTGQVQMIAPDGTSGYVSPSEVGRLEKLGYKR